MVSSEIGRVCYWSTKHLTRDWCHISTLGLGASTSGLLNCRQADVIQTSSRCCSTCRGSHPPCPCTNHTRCPSGYLFGARCCSQTRKAPFLETDVTWSAGWKWTAQLACRMEPGTSSFPSLEGYSSKTFQQSPANANMSIMLEQHIGRQTHLVKRNNTEGNARLFCQNL